MKNKNLILIILLFVCCVSQKEKEVGSPESGSINTWINVARDSTQLPLERRKQFLEDAEYTANTLSNDTIRLDHLSRISLAYKRLQDSLGFRKMNLKVRKSAMKNDIFKALGESHWDLAAFFKSYGIMDSAYFHYQRAHKSFNKLAQDSTSLSLQARMQYGMGQVQEHYKDYLGAESNLTKALRIFEDLQDYKRIYNCNNMLGISASGMNNSEKSLEYYRKAGSYLDAFQANNKMTFIWENKNNIASELLQSEKYRDAKKEYDQLLKDKKLKKENPKLYSIAIGGKAYALLKIGEDLNQVDKLLHEAISINDSLGIVINRSTPRHYLAELKAFQGDTINAKKIATQALLLARKTSNNYRILEVLKFLTDIDSNNALAYSKEYYELSEHINEEERSIRDKFARIRLETDEVIEQNELLTRQKQIWFGAALGVVALGIAFFVIVAQRVSNNKLKFEQKQQESNQEIYNLMLSQQGKFEEGKQLEKKRISEELHDGILGHMLGIRLILSGLNDRNDDTAVEQRAELIEKLRLVEEEIRTISHELSNASYQKIHNFIVSIEELINTTSESAGIACSFEFDEEVSWDKLDGDIKINAYRIVQESLQNCVKHARCKKVDVNFSIEENMLKLVVADDGVGFDTGKGKRGIGHRNVISRVEKLNGTLRFHSKKGQGTTVSVTLPAHFVNLDSPAKVEEYRQVLNV